MTPPMTPPMSTPPAGHRDSAIAVEDRLFRALAVLRAITLLNAVGINLFRRNELIHPWAGAAVVALVGVALETTPWTLLGLAFLVPGLRAVRLVLGGSTGRELIPVLQLTGVAELLYAVGLFLGVVLSRLG